MPYPVIVNIRVQTLMRPNVAYLPGAMGTHPTSPSWRMTIADKTNITNSPQHSLLHIKIPTKILRLAKRVNTYLGYCIKMLYAAQNALEVYMAPDAELRKPKQLWIRVTIDQHAHILNIANQEHQSISEMMYLALDEYFRKQGYDPIPKTPPPKRPGRRPTP